MCKQTDFSLLLKCEKLRILKKNAAAGACLWETAGAHCGEAVSYTHLHSLPKGAFIVGAEITGHYNGKAAGQSCEKGQQQLVKGTGSADGCQRRIAQSAADDTGIRQIVA